MTDSRNDTSMADVSAKPVTRRAALAGGTLAVGREAFEYITNGRLPKGDALALAEFAGIMAAKQTAGLIPLCHPLPLNRVMVRSVLRPGQWAIELFCYAETEAKTGVEMEALCGLSVALLTAWDLVKPINPALEVREQRLLFKCGGKHGEWRHPDGLPEEAEALLEDWLGGG